MLKDSKYDGKGGLWKANHPKIAGQGSIQIGGRIIALTIWHNKRGGSAPDYNITVNEQKTGFDELCWFKSLHMWDVKVTPDSISNAMREAHSHPNPDEDIPF